MKININFIIIYLLKLIILSCKLKDLEFNDINNNLS